MSRENRPKSFHFFIFILYFFLRFCTLGRGGCADLHDQEVQVRVASRSEFFLFFFLSLNKIVDHFHLSFVFSTYSIYVKIDDKSQFLIISNTLKKSKLSILVHLLTTWQHKSYYMKMHAKTASTDHILSAMQQQRDHLAQYFKCNN